MSTNCGIETAVAAFNADLVLTAELTSERRAAAIDHDGDEHPAKASPGGKHGKHSKHRGKGHRR